MRLRVIVPLVLAAALALGACGGSSSGSPKASGSTTTVTIYPVATKDPSVSAKMICEKEAIDEIASSLGVKATRVTKPTWKNHVYSCTYVYPKGSYTLSVKEMSSTQETTAYFDAFKKSLGVAQNLFGLGQGAFLTKNNDVVVRKDYKVMLVDVSKVPTGFSAFVPAMTRTDVATNVAAVIMSCWSGA